MKILTALTYYRPHVSGLTIYVERLAKALAARGHDVTVLTSQYEPDLPRREVMHGVEVLRVPVLFRVSKGVVMPAIGFEATRQVLRHEVIHLHLPQLDAAGISVRGRIFGRPVVLTYHSDLRLPPGLVNTVASPVVDIANKISGLLADRVVAYTRDFATHSPYLSQYLDKVEVIPPPVEVANVESEVVAEFKRRHGGRGPVIGMAARLATEKGVEYLLEALPKVLVQYPNAKVLFAGPYENVLGERDYARRLEPMIREFEEHWTFLGLIEPHEMSAFYRTCDVTVLPSLNSTETFGLVQIESMICGTPVVASNLPGVRQPVRMTGMGEVVPVADADFLAQGILKVLNYKSEYLGDREAIASDFSPDSTAARYESLFSELLGNSEKEAGGP